MKLMVGALGLLALLTGCSREPQGRNLPPRPEQPQARPQRPIPTVDPKSSRAAEDLVEGFIRLLNEGRIADAYMLLGPNAPPRSQFEHQWSSYSNLLVRRGSAGAQDGAAGSIYVPVPLT